MRKALLTLALFASAASADVTRYPAANRPACTDGTPRTVWVTLSSSTTDCRSTAEGNGGGTDEAFCCCANGSWGACASSGGGNAFTTIDLPTGTDPVADSATDTLAVTCAAPLTCTGTSTPDAWALAWTYTPGPLITLDLGDDGGNDSTALAEIATDNDDYNVVTEPSADKALIDFAKVPPYQQYDPDRPPASFGTGGWREEWTGNTASQTWTWGNQDSATETLIYDGAVVVGDATNDEQRMRWVAAATNADQTFTVKVINVATGLGVNQGCMTASLIAGTIATPTAMELLSFGDYAADNIAFFSDADYNRGNGGTTHGAANTTWSMPNYSSTHACLQIRYTDSSRDMSGWIAWDCKSWVEVSSATTVSADPLYWGYGLRDEATCRFEWAQLRTDANRNDASDD